MVIMRGVKKVKVIFPIHYQIVILTLLTKTLNNMDTKKFLTGTLAGGVVYFFLGYLDLRCFAAGVL